ncbi:acyl-CoA dehydrogenase family protein [Desulfocicer niacini]
MYFNLTKAQKMIQKEVQDFAKKEIAPRAEELERNGKYPYNIMAKMAWRGRTAMPIAQIMGQIFTMGNKQL